MFEQFGQHLLQGFVGALCHEMKLWHKDITARVVIFSIAALAVGSVVALFIGYYDKQSAQSCISAGFVVAFWVNGSDETIDTLKAIWQLYQGTKG